jgi:hypothetical protein
LPTSLFDSVILSALLDLSVLLPDSAALSALLTLSEAESSESSEEPQPESIRHKAAAARMAEILPKKFIFFLSFQI